MTNKAKVEKSLRELAAATTKWLHMHSLKRGVSMTEATRALAELVRATKQANLTIDDLEG